MIAKELADQYTSEHHGVGMRIEQRGHGIMCVCHDLSLAQTPFLACSPTILKSGNGVGRYVAAIMDGGSAQLCNKIALHDELIKIGVDREGK